MKGLIVSWRRASLALYLVLFSSCSQSPTQSKNQDKSDLFFRYGTEKLVEKDYPGALDFLLKAHALTPKNPQILHNLGLAYFIQGDRESALKFTQMAVDMDPTNSDALTNLGSLYFRMGNLTKAQELYEQVLKDLTYKRQFRTHYNLGLIALEKGEKVKALAHWQKSNSINPDYCAAYFNKGMLFQEGRLFDKAHEQFKKGIQGTCFNNPATHFELGRTEVKMKRYEEAQMRFVDLTERFKNSQYAKLAKEELYKLHSKMTKNAKTQVAQ